MYKKENFFKNYFIGSKKYKINLKKTKEAFQSLLIDIKNNQVPLLDSFEKKYEFDFSRPVVKKFYKYKNIVIIGNNTFKYCFTINKKNLPSETPYLKLTSPSGNIWEFVADLYHEEFSLENPIDPNSSQMRVMRGGAWMFKAKDTHVALRLLYGSCSREGYIGFRVGRRVS